MAVLAFETLTVDRYGQLQTQQTLTTESLSEALADGVSLQLVTIPAGTFLMGSPKSELGWHPTQAPQHEVEVAAFWMSIYPITQIQWQVVAALPKVNQSLVPQPACFKGDHRPVEQVSWLDAVEFCARLSLQTGRHYRLPSEAEWEYACRATTHTPFHFGETITTDLANYSGVDWEYEGRICSKGFYGEGPTGCDRRETTAVGSFRVANAFGLFDMHGNVREWCQDCWHPAYDHAPTDSSAWIEGGDCTQRVLRGGSWNGGPRSCRAAARGRMEPEGSLYDVGFRVVCE